MIQHTPWQKPVFIHQSFFLLFYFKEAPLRQICVLIQRRGQGVNLIKRALMHNIQSSEAVSKSRWTSWAPVPNKPTVSVDVT